MHQYAIAARSKLENFAPMISLCAERGVLSFRNANIVLASMYELGRALTKTFIHNPLVLFEPSAIPLCHIWSYENKFSRPYMT